jgi:cytochrome oxidase assembly protein ShyY1
MLIGDISDQQRKVAINAGIVTTTLAIQISLASWSISKLREEARVQKKMCDSMREPKTNEGINCLNNGKYR